MPVLPIRSGAEIVGHASVEREGMVYLVRCDVACENMTVPRIVLRSKKGAISCGCCIPNGQRAALTKRVSARLWDLDTAEIEAEFGCSMTRFPVKEGEAFDGLRSLPMAIYVPESKSIAVFTE